MLLATRAGAEVKTLAEFYAHLDQAAAVLKAKADLESQHSDLLAKEALKGLELFGGISAGYQKSPFAKEPFGRFFDPAARLGLRYPLLGSAEKQQRAISDAATQVKVEEIRLNWSKRLATLFLEENYAAYWSAQKLLALNNSYIRLRSGGVERLLHRRREAGLLLMSDYFEFLSAFEQAERARLEFNNNKDQALMRLAQLTNTTITPFEAIKPSLEQIGSNPVFDVVQPDLDILQAQIDNLQMVKGTENWQGIDSDISATVFGGPAIPHPSSNSTQFGYGGAVGFNFRMPLEIISYRKNEKSRLSSQLGSLQIEHTRRKQEINLEFGSTLSRYQQLAQQIKFQRTRLDAARESIRERYLRLHALDGDVLEKYFQAINTYYRAAIEYVDAETEQWKLHIRLRQFVSVLSNTGERAHPEIGLLSLAEPLQQARQYLSKQSITETKPRILSTPSDTYTSTRFNPTSEGFTVYVWRYDSLLAQPEFWKQSQTLQINRVLLSLNKKEITAIASNPQPINKFLSDAHNHGMRIELLLGDPNWILPKERMDLLEIIKKLSNVDFDGLHLDIEPDQLEAELAGKTRLEAFIETIRRVKTITSWPVGISIHPRYLVNESSFGLCVPCQLKQLAVNEIAVMYYSLNRPKIVAALKSVMNKHPDLLFSLAQSLESDLGSGSSYAHKPRPVFSNAMQQLRNQLQAPNFGGLIIQSWQDWEAYNHENPL